MTRKKGQIAHIDQDPSNARENNLVFLCIDHHDEYDSTTSQVKGITEAELLSYKDRLVKAVLAGEHLQAAAALSALAAKAAAIRKHDKRLFRAANDLLPEVFLRDFLDILQSDDSYTMGYRERLVKFVHTFSETGNQFMDAALSENLQLLQLSLGALLQFLSKHFFVFPSGRSVDDLRLCLHPHLNVDRAGTGKPEEMARYAALQSELDAKSRDVRTAYDNYRIAVKHSLCL